MRSGEGSSEPNTALGSGSRGPIGQVVHRQFCSNPFAPLGTRAVRSVVLAVRFALRGLDMVKPSDVC